MSPGLWTGEAAEAHDFGRGSAAIAVAFDERLENVEVVYEFRERDSDDIDATNGFSLKLTTPGRTHERR